MCWEMCPLCVQDEESITTGEHQVLLQWSGFALLQFSLARTTFPRIPSLRGLEVTFDHRKYFPEIWKVGMKQELLSSEGADNSCHCHPISCSWYWCEQWLDTTAFYFPAPIRSPSASLSPGSDAYCSTVKATSFSMPWSLEVVRTRCKSGLSSWVVICPGPSMPHTQLFFLAASPPDLVISDSTTDTVAASFCWVLHHLFTTTVCACLSAC